jgi:hypothetical protein
MNRCLLIAFVLASVGFVFVGTDFAQDVAGKVTTINPEGNCVTFQFRFLVLENLRYNSAIRHIEIFLDNNAFTEKKLTDLFRYISASNPEPMNLTVVVYTDWKQLQVFTDCPPIAVTNQPAKADEYDYHRATFWRRQINGVRKEFFEYNPILRTANFKTVSLPVK